MANPTLTFAAGGDAGIQPWSTVDGSSAVTVVAGVGRSGGKVFDVNLSAAKGQIFTAASVGSTTLLVAQFRFQFVTLPGANVVSLAGLYPSNFNGQMGWTQSTGVLNIGVTGGATSQGSTVLVAGQWYQIDWRWNIAANPWIIDWAVGGVTQPQASIATAADTGTQFAIGSSAGAAPTESYHARYEDIVCSATSGDFPMPSMNVQPWTVQTVTGTHNQTTGDLQTDASVNVTNGDSTGSKITEIPADVTSYIKQTVIRTTTYYEALYGTGTATAPPVGVQQVVAASLVSGTTGTEKSQLFDGTTASDAYALSSPGGVTLKWRLKMWATSPTGGAWTANQLNSARLRWGFADNVTGNPLVSFSVLEAAFLDSVAAPLVRGPLSSMLWARPPKPVTYTPFSALARGTPGLVLYLPFGEASGTVANDAVALDDGTYTGGFTLGQPGLSLYEPSRTSVLLNGTSGNILVGASHIAALGDNFSIMVGLKRTVTGNAAQRLYDRNPSGDFQLFISSANGGLPDHWDIEWQGGGAAMCVSTSTLDATSPHLICATKAGASIHLYQDGVDVSGAITNQTVTGATGTIEIGEHRSGGSDFFNGTLQDYLLWNRAISAAEQLALWNAWGFQFGLLAGLWVDDGGIDQIDGLMLDPVQR